MSPIRRNTVVFHIGAHKTGTSLLQKYMRDNVRLLRRHRIYYLSRGAMNDYVGWGGNLLRDPGPLDRKLRQEIFERAAAEEALRLAKAEADEANLSKTRFLAAASHDLLQPLNAARLFVTALAERALSRLGGTDDIYEAYASYNAGNSYAELGNCERALPLLQRSEDVQGQRSEIDEARAKCS